MLAYCFLKFHIQTTYTEMKVFTWCHTAGGFIQQLYLEPHVHLNEVCVNN